MPSQELNLLARLAVAAQVERPALLSSIEMLRRVEDSLQLLREGKLSTGRFKLHEDNLLVLSGLCALVTDSDRGSVASRLADSGALCDFLEELPWPEDEFGEREEMLRQCAFSAWRNARVLGDRQAVAKWCRRYAQSLWRDIAARELLEYVLQLHAEGSDDLDDETVFALCLLLKGETFDAAATASKASSLFAWLSAPSPVVGIADEREYFLGELALTAGRAFSKLSRLNEAESWFDRACSAFRKTRDPLPLLCGVERQRRPASPYKAFESYSHAVEDYIEEARMVAKTYLATPAAERSEEFQKNHLSDPEVLLSICGILRDQRDVSPATTAAEACTIYRWLARYGEKKSAAERFGLILAGEKRDPSRRRDYFFGDELDYFLGESAFLAGTGYRHLGQRAEALGWLDRAEAGFHHTANCGAGLANVAYARLCLRFEMRRHEDVLDLLPSLIRRYEELGMQREIAKCRLLEAMTLKVCGRVAEAFEGLRVVCDSPAVKADRPFHGRVLAELGDIHQLEGRSVAAMTAYQKALPLLQEEGLSVGLATLKLVVGAAFRTQQKLGQAIEALRAAQQDFRKLGMSTYIAYLHVLIAETFLAMHHDREAEREILAALPTIEEQKMVPEGFAAVALLRESVRRQKTDPEALRQLREHLQAKG